MIMPSSHSASKFRLMMLWAIPFLIVFLFIAPNVSHATKIFSPKWLTDRVWQFGRGDGSVIAKTIRLRPGGKIEGYSHYNESRWGMEGNTLVFYDGSGQPTCRFTTAQTVDGKVVLSGPFIPNTQISHVLREVASQQPQSSQPPTGAAGSGIDWNKPWLDWRVQNCVRRYLRERVLPLENEEQRRNNQPVFTHIDEWGRLLNQSITPHGTVDGNWDNPTHYVWYAYNLDNARRRYGYTVEEWIKQFCLPDQASGGAVTGGQPTGTGPAAGSGIDWNKPWLDWRVQNCVRRYLRERVLPLENEEQRRNNQPVFTHIDEWGRLLNQSITPHGTVDGNWDNPTHYVWYAYNLDNARRRYGYTVEEWIKQFCLPDQASGGAVTGGQPTGTGPAAGSGIDWNKPWLDWRVQNCVRRYLRERVLPLENEEQRRNNQPVFTHIDEWGRLLNQSITPHGTVDGNWDNPTHYVWYAYNLDNARRRYGYTVEEWIKQFCLPDQASGGAVTGGQPTGTGPAAGSGIDWNKPWLDWRVQNCVRRYLRERVLPLENEEQRRNNQPVFTHIDEWGRLLNQSITPHGTVDGNWDNPTHYVWYAYNLDNARRRYGYTVEEWIKQFCLPDQASGGAVTGGQPTGTGPAAGSGIDWNKPWLDWRVQNCVRRYLRERVLPLENEEQRRNNQPVFTHIDEWGRLLNQSITPHGTVDGNWDNPTHYVWYAYNLDNARRRYGYTVEEWIKQFCLPDQASGGAVTGGQPTGTGPAAGSGIDWNKPWLDWRVQNCVRRYLRERVLPLENEEQRRNNQPVFTHIDEWGRLLNQSITPHGTVDGNWDNPTHYVWYAYNLDNARRRYGYTVEEWIKQFCLPDQASGGAVTGGQPTGTGPAAGSGIDWNKPWLDWRVQNCVRRYLRERVLPLENEEQRRNNQPVFTHIDEWGRLLNQSITPHGTVDGNWDNPTHYVWYAYNLDNARRRYGYTVEEWIKQFCLPDQASGDSVRSAPTATDHDEEESPFDDNYDEFIQTQTSRDETRIAQVQDQLISDQAASFTGDKGNFGDQLSDRLDEVSSSIQPTQDDRHTETDQGSSTPTQTSPTPTATQPSSPQAEPTAPESKCETVSLTPGSWRQLENNRGPLSSGQGGLVLRGDEWTNGKLKNGKLDGNGVESIKAFDLKNGGDVYLTFKVNDGGNYLGIFPKIFSGAGYKLLTTDHAWAASTVVPNNVNLYAHFKVDGNGKYKTIICKGAYDDNGGSPIAQYSGTLKNRTGRVWVRFVDNYAGVKAYLVMLHAEVCAQKDAATAVPTKPPVQIGCDTTTKQGGNKPETFIVELGQKSGAFMFKYNMYSVPDRMLVEYEGKKLFDTGCIGNKQGAGKGAGSKSITYSGSSTKVTVKVLPSCEGGSTQWTFTANCPTQPPAGKPPSKKALGWHSSTVCSESEGMQYRWRWNVNLSQSGTQVSGNIYFHRCPGGGRAAYAVSGEVRKDGSFKVTGKKVGGRGGLYSSAPQSVAFILYEGKAPNPNLAP
jgi:hypothetical protein